MNNLDPKTGVVSLDGTKIDGCLTIENFLSTPLAKLCVRSAHVHPPLQEFTKTPITLWRWKFTCVIRFNNGKIQDVLFFWLDSDLADRCEWSDIVQADQVSDFHALSSFVEKAVEHPPSRILARQNEWHYSWGGIQTWWEDRSYTEGIRVYWR